MTARAGRRAATSVSTAPGERAKLPIALFDYELPPELIAQEPAEPRDASRLLVLPRAGGPLEHRVFRDLPELLRPGDLLVANRSRVLPARFVGRKLPTGGKVELLLLRRLDRGRWVALGRPGARLQPGARLSLAEGRLEATVLDRAPEGARVVEFAGADPDAAVLRYGLVPLPPYIRDYRGDPERYQTVYGDTLGSAAAPTAGLHFTPALLARLEALGVGLKFVTLHVGADTFRPIKTAYADEHPMHAEYCEAPRETLEAVLATRAAGGRVIAVGTTTVRTLESAFAWLAETTGGGAVAGPAERSDAPAPGSVPPDGYRGWTRLYIQPGYHFRAIDGLITNFHQPRSTLLLLVSALVGRERLLAAYAEAVRLRYRFHSFGDAMLVW